MITIYLIAQNFFGEEMWIIHEGYPGGSGQYYADNAAVWYQTFGSASSVVMNVMSDAFLVMISYRHTLLINTEYICHRFTAPTLFGRIGGLLSSLPSFILQPLVGFSMLTLIIYRRANM